MPNPELTLRLQKLKNSGEHGEKSLHKSAEKLLEKSGENSLQKSGEKSPEGDRPLHRSGEKVEESTDSKTESQNADSEKSPAEAASQPTKHQEKPIPTTAPELEVELKKEMQEIQALKLALESGGMGIKERAETHHRFGGLLQHLKAMLATYKELTQHDRSDESGYKKGDELTTIMEEANIHHE